MCNIYTIAYEYAKAIFDLSVEQNNFHQTRLMLEFFAKISQNNLIQSLCFRMIESKRVSTIFIAIYEDYYQKKISNLGYKIIHVIAENRRVLLFPMVSKKFNDLLDKYLCFLKVEIISARILNDNELKKITEVITCYLSKTIQVIYHVNHNILAGIIIRIGDTVIDGSLSSRISRLRSVMGC